MARSGRPPRIEHAGLPWGERIAASPPRPPTPFGLLRSRPFGPVEGRYRDFANAAGQFARLQPACAADAFAPALAARSRLDGRCSFAAKRYAFGCSPRRYLGVRFGLFMSRRVCPRRESLSLLALGRAATEGSVGHRPIIGLRSASSLAPRLLATAQANPPTHKNGRIG